MAREGGERRVSRSPVFWIALFLLSAAGVVAAFRFFPDAFPIVQLDVRMSRAQALAAAAERDRRLQLAPAGFREAASFDLDESVQNYVELAGGGPKAFADLLREKLYSPYAWKVRHYLPLEERESRIWYTPEGEPYGFQRRIPETEKGAALPADRARAIAEETARRDWNLDLAGYKLLEQSKTIRPSGRADYSLVYERQDRAVGEAKFRIRLEIAGDRLNGLEHYVHVPESFTLHYSEMRSSNNTIAMFASVAMVLLYIFGGCGAGLAYLARKRWVIWKPALAWGLAIGALQLLDALNRLPLAWMGYDTAVSPGQFLAKQVGGAFATGLFDGLLLAVTFMAAEGLSRRAFPRQPQLWKIWSPEAAPTRGVLGRTVGGYLTVGFLFGFVTLLYTAGRKWLGWWTPSEALFHPDVLAVPFPWLTAIANSLHAGFWEESLFRAVPLAGAALIGERLGRRRLWLGIGFVLQALIFASAHANYPAQPSYARVVELIVPSFVFGSAYLGFGLLPGIIMHFTFDVVWFALPLFTASVERIWLERVIVTALSLVPLWIVLATRAWCRLNGRGWGEIPASLLNGSWLPPSAALQAEEAEETPSPRRIGPKLRAALAGGGVLALIAAFQGGRTPVDAFRLETSRTQAIAAARRALTDAGYRLGPEWQALAHVEATPGEDDRFVWRTSGPAIYHALMGSYLPPPDWEVRFVRWQGSVDERAEEYEVYVDRDSRIQRLRHQLPESRPGAKLDENAARKLAEQAIRQRYRLDPEHLREISASPEALPKRTDWLFYFQNPEIRLKQGEARIGVRLMGDEAAGTRQLVHVPDQWIREDRASRQGLSMARNVLWAARVLLLLAALAACVAAWARSRFDARAAATTFGALLAVGVVTTLVEIPAAVARFTTAEPFSHQMASGLATSLILDLVISGLAALFVGYLARVAVSGRTASERATEVVSALGLGALCSAATAIVGAHLPRLSPHWGDYSGADSWAPAVAELSSLSGYVIRTAILLIAFRIADRWSRKGAGRWFAPPTLVLAGGLLLTADPHAESFAQWGAIAIASGLSQLAAWWLCRRGRLAMLPLVTAAQAVVTLALFATQSLYPGAAPGALLTSAFVLGAGFLWYRSLSSAAPSQP